jgi:hypothetical protein
MGLSQLVIDRMVPRCLLTFAAAGGGEGDEEGDYLSGQDDDADDEGTLEEEERLAAAEAGGEHVVAAAEKAEAAGLADDADVPLEQLLPPELLARYGLAPAPAAAAAAPAGGEAPGGLSVCLLDVSLSLSSLFPYLLFPCALLTFSLRSRVGGHRLRTALRHPRSWAAGSAGYTAPFADCRGPSSPVLVPSVHWSAGHFPYAGL